MPFLLLLLLSLALSIGIGIIVLLIRRAQEKAPCEQISSNRSAPCPYREACLFRRPGCWLAIKSRSLPAVQSALGVHNPKPCSLTQGLAGDEKLFIAPPVKGWVLVTGSGLPDPSEDIDACFRFILDVSRRLGQVQFFCASRVLHHHAWVKADRGRVIRAYAWAGQTLWHQGSCTPAEKDLDLKCFDYTESAAYPFFIQDETLCSNVDKVPLLAARWSLDPARIDERQLDAECGIAGELSRRY